MHTITKNQETLSPQLFAELQEKAKKFGVSLAEYIKGSTFLEKAITEAEEDQMLGEMAKEAEKEGYISVKESKKFLKEMEACLK